MQWIFNGNNIVDLHQKYQGDGVGKIFSCCFENAKCSGSLNEVQKERNLHLLQLRNKKEGHNNKM